MSGDNEKVKAALEKSFEDLLKKINERFEQSGGQMQGLGDWMRKQLQILKNEIRQIKLSYIVVDISISSLIELLEEKGYLTSEEYDEKTKELFERKNKTTKDKG